MPKTHNLSVPVAIYERGGQTFTKWQDVGAIFTNSEGKMSIRINCLPTHQLDQNNEEEPWRGWIKVFPCEPDQGYVRSHSGRPDPEYDAAVGHKLDPGDFDDIPF